MTCKFCGNEIEDGSTFCFICGQPVEAQEPAKDEAIVDEAAETVVEANEDVAAEEPIVDETAEAPAEEENVEETAAEEAVVVDGVKDPNKPGKFLLFLCFLSIIVGLICYVKARNNGNDARKAYIANAMFLGLNIKLVAVIGYLAKSFMI